MANLLGIEFRPVTISEGDQFVSLMNRTYARKKTIEYFKWQFFDSLLKSVLMGAFLKERLIGCFGLQCRKLNNDLIAGQAIDLIVDEKFRRRGIFTKLGEAAVDYFGDSLDFCFSLPNASGREALGGSLGYKTIMVIKTLVLTTVKGKNNYNSARIIETWDDLAIEDNKKAQNKSLYFVRDLEELKWRFGDNPDYSYSIIKINGDAFAIVKIFVDPVTHEHFGDIVDFGFKVEGVSLLQNLFCSAANYLREKTVSGITSWASSNNLVRILDRIGFVQTSQERYFCINVFKSGHEYLHDASNWLLVQADAEIY